jgi:type I restriction enzyme, S subunit
MEAKRRHSMVAHTFAFKHDYQQEERQYTDLPQEDIKWCTVSLAEIINAKKRLEATVFNLEGKHAREIIAQCKWENVPLSGPNGLLATAYTGGRFKRIWLESSDFPIYQPSSITDLKPTPDGFLSRITKTDLDALRVSKGQLLLTCSGTIGKLALVSATLENKIFSHDLIRMNVRKSEDIGFIYTYLRSKIGNTILQTNNYGAVIQHIEPEHLINIPIPNPPEKIKLQINDLIMHSFLLRDASNDLIDQAMILLTIALKLPPIHEFITTKFDNSADVHNYSVKLSKLFGRLDGSYHVPIVTAITKHLAKYAAELITVGDKRVSKKIILPGRFKRVYVDEGQGRVFFGGKQLYELDPSNKKYLSISKHSNRIKNELEITENTILITRSGTIGKINIAPKHWEHWIASDHIIRVLPIDDSIAGYLYIFLASEYGYQLITRFTYGSVVDEIDDNHVSQIPFPILKDVDTQAEINHLALEANELRYQAYQLEQEAMQVMDNKVIYAR